MTIPTIDMGWSGVQDATPYATVVEGIYAYNSLAEDVMEGEWEPQVYLCEGTIGGFLVGATSVRILPSWGDNPEPTWIGFDLYVTVQDALRLEAAGLATYQGRCDDIHAAIAQMADNAIPRGPEYTLMGGRWERLMTYEEGRAVMHGCHSIGCNIGLMPTPDPNVREVIPIGDVPNTEYEGEPLPWGSGYIGDADGRRLAEEQGAGLYEWE